jgi:excisionase family DNA binding protein
MKGGLAMQNSQLLFAEALAELVRDAVREVVREELSDIRHAPSSGPVEGTYSANEVADMLGTTRQAVYALIEEEGLPALKCMGKWRIPIRRLEEWMIKLEKKAEACNG